VIGPRGLDLVFRPIIARYRRTVNWVCLFVDGCRPLIGREAEFGESGVQVHSFRTHAADTSDQQFRGHNFTISGGRQRATLERAGQLIYSRFNEFRGV
jgi:hypothetical protein